jgi:antitoxin FitA
MVLGQESVFIDFEMRPIGHRRLPGPPLAHQLELKVQVDEIRRRRPQVRDVDVPAIDKGELIGGHRAVQMARSLRGPQSTAVRKGGKHVPPSRFFDLRTQARRRSKVSAPLSPVLGIGDGFQQHPFSQRSDLVSRSRGRGDDARTTGPFELFRLTAINASIGFVKALELPNLATEEASVAQLIVRDLSEDLVKALKQRAAKRNRSTEQEHREILQSVLRSPKRRHLADVLAAIPNVGEDSDFEREQTDKRG